MANELDELMDKDPLELSAQDIDKIIKIQRQARQNWEAGIKPKKGTSQGEVKIDLVELGLTSPRVTGTVRRI